MHANGVGRIDVEIPDLAEYLDQLLGIRVIERATESGELGILFCGRP